MRQWKRGGDLKDSAPGGLGMNSSLLNPPRSNLGCGLIPLIVPGKAAAAFPAVMQAANRYRTDDVTIEAGEVWGSGGSGLVTR